MTESEFYNKTDEVVSKFKNGKELYQKSALFNRSVQMLVRGVTEYELIEHLIYITEDSTKSFEEYIQRDRRPMMITGSLKSSAFPSNEEIRDQTERINNLCELSDKLRNNQINKQL